jgi:predicted nucleotidyltransferase component of viral defense system
VSFVHERGDEFADLIEIIAGERGLRRSIIEKDDWVTHALWALSLGGFEVWFKGGTSLSKGFGLIERFSEDLDLKIEPGSVTALRARDPLRPARHHVLGAPIARRDRAQR